MDSVKDQISTPFLSQPWLRSAHFDVLCIAAPAFITSIVALIFKDQIENMKTLPLWAWVSFVLLVDVAHVYATLFRTYLDPQARRKNGALLTVVPIACWVVGSLLYSINGILFWRVLAYLAVFHFMRQQFGFVALYSRKESPLALKWKKLDLACVYLATLYPLLYWHTNLPRNFSWFVEGDFIERLPNLFSELCLFVYALVAFIYVIKELFLLRTTGAFNVPKNLIIVGTALSWWVAIVAINSDMSFTMINVISHGVPYMALIWLYHHSSSNQPAQSVPQSKSVNKVDSFFRTIVTFVPAFVAFLCILAYFEEGLWAGLVWREHLSIFRPFASLPAITDGSILALLVPLLSLPQSTHYVLDGFIWRVKDRSSVWSA